jgi:ubiquinone/menaquinone biosynthesis C-methylase UbiE
MTDASSEQHNQLIVDQFTRMAKPFAEMPAHSNEQAMRLLAEAAGVSKEDRVLDVCCGTGIVACALAPIARDVTGIDLTPAMLEQARKLQREAGLENLSWQVGDVAAMPFGDEMFSVVVSRYALHHLLEPARVLQEMARVCRQGGKVVVADVFASGVEQGGAYDRVEKLRDPSHVRALRLDEITAMFQAAGMPVSGTTFYRLTVGLEDLLQASATAPDAAARVRRVLAADVDRNETGMSPKWVDGGIQFSFPVVVVSATKL